MPRMQLIGIVWTLLVVATIVGGFRVEILRRRALKESVWETKAVDRAAEREAWFEATQAKIVTILEGNDVSNGFAVYQILDHLGDDGLSESKLEKILLNMTVEGAIETRYTATARYYYPKGGQ